MTSLPRVLAVIPRADDWKMALFTRQTESIAALGCPVDLFFLASRTNPAVLWRERARLRRQIRAFRPDLVHAHFGTVTACFTVTATRLPVVVTFRGSDLNPSGPDDGRLRLAASHVLSHLAALRASRVICVTEQLKSRLRFGRRDAAVIPTGVDTTRFRPLDRAACRRQAGWSADERVVLFGAGVTDRNKGGALVRAAVDEVNRTLPVRLVVMDGTTAPNDVPVLMNAADCLAFASRHEGSPNVVKEAIACGLPVVSVAVGDVPERLAGVVPSAIVERDAAAMASAMVALLRNPARSNGFAHVASISREAVAARIVDVYRQCLGWPATAPERTRE